MKRKESAFTENFDFLFPPLFSAAYFFCMVQILLDEEKYGETKATWRKSVVGPEEKKHKYLPQINLQRVS